MRIFLCKSHFAGRVSGADQTLAAYATNLHKRGVRIAVVLLHPSVEASQYFDRLREAGVEVVTIARNPLAYIFMRNAKSFALFLARVLGLSTESMRRSRKLIQRIAQWLSLLQLEACRTYFMQFPADMIHVMTPDSGAATIIRAASAAGIPVLYQELGTPDYLPPLEPHYEQFLKVLPLCSEVAALSPRLARQWRAKFSTAAAISVLPLLVEDTRGLSGPRTKPEAGVTFGFAARLERGKGPMILVDAFARLRQRLPATCLRVAGEGSQGAAVKARARELKVLDACHFTRAYADLDVKAAFMQSLDVFVLPTLADGTPNSIIEAMAHGLPVIASAVGGIPDLVTSETGIVIPPNDLEALLSAMTLLVSDPEMRRRMGRAARVRYEELFSPEAVLPTLENAYQRVVTSRHKTRLAPSTSAFIHPWIESTQE